MLIALALLGCWTYLIATRSPISAWGFQRLSLDISRAELEDLLGGPAMSVEELSPHDKERGVQGFAGNIAVFPPKGSKMGDFSGEVIELARTKNLRSSTEIHAWEGPEGEIYVTLDSEGRLNGATFLPRITWRYRIRQWLPWLL